MCWGEVWESVSWGKWGSVLGCEERCGEKYERN